MERQYVIARHFIDEDGNDKPQYLGAGTTDTGGDGSAWYDSIDAPEVLKTTQRFAAYHLEHLRIKQLETVCGARVEPV